MIRDALSRAVLSSAPADGEGGGGDAAALVEALASAVPEVFSLGPPRLGRESEGPVLRIDRSADAGAARARLVAAAAPHIGDGVR